MTAEDQQFNECIERALLALLDALFTLLAAGPALDAEERALLRLSADEISQVLSVPLDDEGPQGILLRLRACRDLASGMLCLVNRLEAALRRAPQTPPVAAALRALEGAGDALAAEVEEMRSRPR